VIDRAALEKVAARHLAGMQPANGISLLLHLHSGARYTVHGFEEFFDAYCVARVYPGDDDLEDEIPLDAHGASVFDRLVLPYSAISYVTLTAREPEGRATIGFLTEWTAKKPG
jgi:hypothetical protein